MLRRLFGNRDPELSDAEIARLQRAQEEAGEQHIAALEAYGSQMANDLDQEITARIEAMPDGWAKDQAREFAARILESNREAQKLLHEISARRIREVTSKPLVED